MMLFKYFMAEAKQNLQKFSTLECIPNSVISILKIGGRFCTLNLLRD